MSKWGLGEWNRSRHEVLQRRCADDSLTTADGHAFPLHAVFDTPRTAVNRVACKPTWTCSAVLLMDPQIRRTVLKPTTKAHS